MKIERNSIFVGGNLQNEQENQKKKSFFAGDSRLAQDPIMQKREQAQKKALKVVGDAFADEQKIDDDLTARRDRIKQLNENMAKAQDAIKQIDKDKEQLRENKGIAADSEEQKDLELIEKRNESMRPNSEVTLTKEDQKRLAQINEKGLTEYQKQALEMESYKSVHRKEIDEGKKLIIEENAIIRGVKLERLKSNPILKAKQEADSIMDAADEEIRGMLIDESKKFIDEKHKEEEEAAKKRAEEQEEKEELIEEIRKDKQEQKERTEKKKTEGLTEQVLELEEVKTDVKAEVEDIVDKMNLVIEDIKGAMVDEKL